MNPENSPGNTAPAVSNPAAPLPETTAPAVAPVAAPAVENNPAPSTETPAVAPVAPVAPAAAPAAPAVESAPAAAPAPAEPAPTAKTTILGTEPPKPAAATVAAPETVKPADGTPPAGDKPKEEGGQSAEPAPLPAYEPFKIAENIQMDEKKLGEFTKELGEFELTTKADHVAVQEFAQKLVDRYVSETQETVQRIVEHYTNTWDKQKNEWREAFIADPELGGNRQETTAANVQNFVGEFGGSAEQVTALRGFMETGVGNQPDLIRLMNNAASTINALRLKYETETNTPLPGQKPFAEKKSKTQTLYGRSSASA